MDQTGSQPSFEGLLARLKQRKFNLHNNYDQLAPLPSDPLPPVPIDNGLPRMQMLPAMPRLPKDPTQGQLGTDAATLSEDMRKFFGGGAPPYGTPEYLAASDALRQRRDDLASRGWQFPTLTPMAAGGGPASSPQRSPSLNLLPPPSNWLGGLGNIASSLGNLGGLFTGSSSGTGGLSNLLGAGLLGIGNNQPVEPGGVTDARQFLRNEFTSPNALSQNFAGQISGLQSSFQPLLDQQRTRDIADIQQRFAAAFPHTVGAQGPEFGTLGQYITDQALPREQGLMGQLGLNLMNTQNNAASSILMANRGNPLADALNRLGSSLLLGQGGGTGGLGGGTPGTGTGQGGLMPPSSYQSIGQLSPAQLAQQLVASGDVNGLMQLLSTGALAGMPFPVALNASSAFGPAIQAAINAGLVESPAATVVGGTTAAQGGLLGGLNPALAGASAGLVGYGVGNLIGPNAPNEATATLLGGASGALGGAATGALIGALGGPIGMGIGAVIGGLAGLFGGFFGEQAQERALKEANRQADIASQGGQVSAESKFWLPTLAAAGVNLDAPIDPKVAQMVVQNAAGGQISSGAPVTLQQMQGKTLRQFAGELVQNVASPQAEQWILDMTMGYSMLQAIQRQNPSIENLDQVPGLRQAYLQAMAGVGGDVMDEALLRASGFRQNASYQLPSLA